MRTHNYNASINDETYMAACAVKHLDKRSLNSLINEGLRLVVAKKQDEMSTWRKTRESMTSAVRSYL